MESVVPKVQRAPSRPALGVEDRKKAFSLAGAYVEKPRRLGEAGELGAGRLVRAVPVGGDFRRRSTRRRAVSTTSRPACTESSARGGSSTRCSTRRRFSERRWAARPPPPEQLFNPEIQFLAYVHNAEDQLRGEAATLSFFSQGQYTNGMVVRIAGLAYQKGLGGPLPQRQLLGRLPRSPRRDHRLPVERRRRRDDAAKRRPCGARTDPHGDLRGADRALHDQGPLRTWRRSLVLPLPRSRTKRFPSVSSPCTARATVWRSSPTATASTCRGRR